MNELPELIKAFEMIEPEVARPIEYRLYYDINGNGLFMSGASGPDGNYINITKQVYDRATVHNLKVVHGELKVIDATAMWLQLRPSESGYAVVKNHPALLLDTDTYKDIEYYDRNN